MSDIFKHYPQTTALKSKIKPIEKGLNDMIITENKTNNKYKSIGRAKQIYFNNNGEPYFRWNNRRIYLDNVMRVIYPIMCYKQYEGDIDYIIGGVYSMGYSGVYVSIDDNSESVTLWEEINKD